MSGVIRNHKDNVFCLLYKEKRNLLSLYNAMNNTSYEREEELEVVTLEGAICLRMKNDAAFVIDSQLNLYEQQSTVNPNMPLRNLYYVTEELKKIAELGKLYQRTKIRIPAPHFVVFYNGTEEQPERQIYSLSDLYERKEEEPELELRTTVLNINEGYNQCLLERCESLKGYMVFVGKIRQKRSATMKLEEAVCQAVDECIREGVLADFFRKNREEITDMSIWEFDQELYEKAMKEDGREEGREEGIMDAITRMLQKNYSAEQILDLGYTESEYMRAKEKLAAGS